MYKWQTLLKSVVSLATVKKNMKFTSSHVMIEVTLADIMVQQ